MILVFNILLVKICAAVDDAELQVHAGTDVDILELRHNITDDYDGSGGLPYRYREKFLENGIIPDVITLAPKNILKHLGDLYCLSIDNQYQTNALNLRKSKNEKSDKESLSEVCKGHVRDSLISPYNYKASLTVKWGWKNIFLGTKMLAEKLREPPQLSWPTERGVLYTLIMTGPDFPTRENPAHREWIYWRVGNIPENDVHYGDVIDGYCGPSMCFEPMPRRFLLLVYKQPVIDKCIQFEEIKKRQVIFHERAHFSTLRFAEKYGFDIYAHAGNFFLVDGINTKV
ncbi:uncharacterized protein [Bemisia tabaci]|uniref:uncharacterized protein isoform X4 n=1 Tax=Bemisia tabaci TaxID=7038 RepID=UPI003B28B981